MSERYFPCSELCSSMELGPDLGPSTKPCDCWNAELTQLRAKVRELEEKIQSLESQHNRKGVNVESATNEELVKLADKDGDQLHRELAHRIRVLTTNLSQREAQLDELVRRIEKVQKA